MCHPFGCNSHPQKFANFNLDLFCKLKHLNLIGMESQVSEWTQNCFRVNFQQCSDSGAKGRSLMSCLQAHIFQSRIGADCSCCLLCWDVQLKKIADFSLLSFLLNGRPNSCNLRHNLLQCYSIINQDNFDPSSPCR